MVFAYLASFAVLEQQLYCCDLRFGVSVLSLCNLGCYCEASGLKEMHGNFCRATFSHQLCFTID